MDINETLTKDSRPRLKSAQIQSLDRGLQLLEYISRATEPLSLSEMEDVLDVDRSTIHRLLSTLVERGYLQQDPESKRYQLGMKVLELSRRILANIPIRKVAKPYLKSLKDSTGESANLAVVVNDQIVCIDQEPSTLALSVSNETGVNFIPYATAIGKMLLAHLSEGERQRLIGGQELKAFTPRTIIDPDALNLHLLQIKHQGYSLDDEERYPGVRCLSAPVFDHRSKIVAALGISAPTIRLTYEKLPEFVAVVKNAAAELSIALGFPPAELE